MSSVLITGANRGLGLEFTRQYLKDGWEVHAFCRRPDKAAELGAMVADSRGNIHLRQMDIGNKEQIEAAAKELKNLPIDLLINNAGIADGYGRGVYEMKEDPDIQNYDFAFWEEMMRINTLAPAKIIGAFLENIRAGGQKKIASLSSGLGSITNLAWAGKYGYCASKAGLNMVSKGLAEWLKSENIIVKNSIYLLHPSPDGLKMLVQNELLLISTQFRKLSRLNLKKLKVCLSSNPMIKKNIL